MVTQQEDEGFLCNEAHRLYTESTIRRVVWCIPNIRRSKSPLIVRAAIPCGPFYGHKTFLALIQSAVPLATMISGVSAFDIGVVAGCTARLAETP